MIAINPWRGLNTYFQKMLQTVISPVTGWASTLVSPSVWHLGKISSVVCCGIWKAWFYQYVIMRNTWVLCFLIELIRTQVKDWRPLQVHSILCRGGPVCGWRAIRGHDQNLQFTCSASIVVRNELCFLCFSKQETYTIVRHSTREFSEGCYLYK